MKHRSLIAQLLAGTLVLGLVTQVRGAPADIAVSAAPMLGADPPKGTDLRDGDSSVSTQTGALQYSYPIDVPPGRLGNQPQLALTYSSQAPLYGGIAAGWNLTIPEIQRDTTQGVLRQFSLDFDAFASRTFLSTMAGSRPLIPVSEPGDAETFRAQNDTTYTRYQRMPEGSAYAWVAYATDGTTYFFGDTYLVDGDVDADRLPLTRTVDPFANTVEYRWSRDPIANELVITSIQYASNPILQLPASARVDFDWKAAPVCAGDDVGSARSYRTGEQELEGGLRLASIEATAFDPASALVQHTRRINLDYAPVDCGAPSAATRLLTSIQESAWGPAAPRVDLPPVTFEYGSAERTAWEWTDQGQWFPDGPLASGERFLGARWPTVDAMLVDLDGDGLVDRMTPTNDDETCRVAWARNTGQGFVPAGNFALPHLPWEVESPFDGCSLNGQYTHVRNIDVGNGSCGVQDSGTYLAYRWLDVTADGLPDLVTAIQHDGNVYDPNDGPVPRFSYLDDDEPLVEWPSCVDAPACLAPDAACMDSATFFCGPPGTAPDRCGFLDDALPTCLADADPVACYLPWSCGSSDATTPDPDCDTGTNPFPSGCDVPQIPHERCGLYPWVVYENLGNGEISTAPQIKLNPLPLESDSGDSPSGAGGFSSSKHAIIDLDGDGLLDAVSISMFKYDADDPGPPLVPNPYFWFVWKGDGTGGFHGDANGNPYFWFVPVSPQAGAAPSFTEAERTTPGIIPPLDLDQIISSTGSLTDVNGDGLPDYVWRKYGTDEVKVYWNNGNQFLVDGSEVLGEGEVTQVSRTFLDVLTYDPVNDNFITEASANRLTRLLDYDADGRVDLLYTEWDPDTGDWSAPELKFNTGSDFGSGYELTSDENFALASSSRAFELGGEFFWETLQDFVDVDGDGLAEKILVDAAGLLKLRNPPTGHPARLMTAFHNGRGLHVDVAYAPLSDPEAVTGDPTTRRATPDTKWVVQSMTTTDDFEASASTTSYHYAFPRWSPDDRGHWGFRGFEIVRTTNARDAVVEERYRYDVDWSGRLAATLTFPAEHPEEPTSIADTEWQRYSLFGGAIETFHPTITRTWTCANGEDEASCRARTPTNPNNGMVRDEQVWTALASTTGADPTPLLYVTTRAYHQRGDVLSEGDRYVDTTYAVDADASTYRLRPTSMVSTWLQGTAFEVFAKSETIWDPTFRVPLEERTYFDEASFAATTRSYEMTTGVVLTVTKPEQLAQVGTPHTAFEYDELRLFVVGTTNELGHVVLTKYDQGTGALLRTTGPNAYACTGICPGGLAEQRRTDVDGLGRPIATYVSRNGAGHYDLVNVTTTAYVDAPPTSITTRELIQYDDTRWTETRTDLDGHGRPVQTTQLGGAGDAVTTFDYDVAGKLAAVTVPDPSPAAGVVTFTYTFDSIGRPASLRRPNGGSGADLTYDGLSSTTTEVAGSDGGPAANTELVNDDFGRLIAVNEGLEGGAVATTTYGYDPRDTIDLVVDPEGVTTTMAHDFAGRRAEITRGARTWRFGYDRNGNVSFEQSPVPVDGLALDYTTSFTYDALDRLTSKLVAPRDLSLQERERYGIAAATQYEYDTTADGLNRVGRLHLVALRGPGYDVLRTTLTYDAEGNVTEDRRDFNFTLNNAAVVSDTRRIHSTYAPGGRIRTIDYGDGVTTDDAATLGRFTYDDRAQPILLELQRAGQPWETAAALTRNIPGLVTERRRTGPPNQVARWKYDELGRIQRVRVTVGGGDVVDQKLNYWGGDDPKTLEHVAQDLDTRNFRFRYDERHQLVAVDTTEDSFRARYRHTDGGRLDRVEVTATSAAGSDVRNREVDYRYTAADPEMLSVLRNLDGAELARYWYDDAGNVRRQELEGVSSRFHWDGEDQLRRTVTPDAPAGAERREDYFYDRAGARIGVVQRDTAGPTRVKYFQGPLEIWLTPTGALDRRLAHVALGTPVARVETTGTGGSVELQYHGPLQSLLAAVSTSGVVNSAFAYGPYGEVLQAAGSEIATHRRRYNDKHQDELTNFVYYGARYFDTVALVWKSADPAYRFMPEAAWGQPRRAALYTFDLGNPLRYVDPDGRNPRTVEDVLRIQAQMHANQMNQLAMVYIAETEGIGAARDFATSLSEPSLLDKVVDFGRSRHPFALYGQVIDAGIGILSGEESGPSPLEEAARTGDVEALSDMEVGRPGMAAGGVGGGAPSAGPPLGGSAGKPLLGKNPKESATRTNTDLPGGKSVAKSIFRNQTKGMKITSKKMDNGGTRRTAGDGTQIRINPDGSARVDLPNRGKRGNETIHFD